MAGREPTYILEGPEDAPNKPLEFGVDGSKTTGPSMTENVPDFSGAVSDLITDPAILLKAVVDTRREEAKMRTTSIDQSLRAFAMYNNSYDHEDKEDWQAKYNIPKLFITVERLTSVLCRIREKSSNWMDCEATQEDLQVFYNLVKNSVKQQLDSDAVNFNRESRIGVKSGIMSNMIYLWVGWIEDGVSVFDEASPVEGESTGFADADLSSLVLGKPGKPSKEDSKGNAMPGSGMSRLEIKALNPDYVYLDSSGSNRYKILEYRYPKGRAMQIARKSGWDLDACERALNASPSGGSADDSDPYTGSYEAREAEKQDRPGNEKDNMVRVTYYFGDLCDQDSGEVLQENCFGICWNDAEWVSSPVPMPFWDGEDPIVAAPLLEVPFAVYGRSPLTMNLDMFALWNEFLNLMVDYFRSVLLGIKEIDMDMISEWDEDFRSGLFPGKFIRTNKRGAATQAITNVPFSDIQPGFFQFTGILQKELQDNTLFADAIGGMPRQRGRVTAMEFNKRSTEAGSLIDFIGESLEDNLYAPLLRKAFHRILQFMSPKLWGEFVDRHSKKFEPKLDQSTPEAQKQTQGKLDEWKKLYEEVKKWSQRERWDKLAGYWKFKVKVYSAIGDKQMEIEKGTFLMQTVAQIPQAAPAIRWDRMLRYIVRAFDWDPEDVLDPNYVPMPVNMIPQQVGQGGGEFNQEGGPPDLMSQFGGHIPGVPFQGMTNTMPTPPPGQATTGPGQTS